MVPVIPKQRQFKIKANKPFDDLINYIEENQEKTLLSPLFDNILNYTSAAQDKNTGKDKCIAIRTHGIGDLSDATAEMNAVSARNTRCKDPAFHFILSWPEHELPDQDAIFEAAEHAIKSLGLADHQYVLAIHGNTDNMHCHIAVNRIHPETYRSHNIEWAVKTLHMAARESEIKHGWAHDNGIYIVQTNVHGQKTIILNPDNAKSISKVVPYAHPELGQEDDLPAWHDPESLESWLKKDIARALNKALPKLHDWNALHAWLAQYDISLIDTGGGGMRLHATSPESGETIDLPASKGLRTLKRSELEKRWGKFTTGAIEPGPYIQSFPSDRTETGETEGSATPCIVPDVSHLNQKQLTKGINHVLRTAPDRGIPPHPGKQLLHAEPDRSIPPTHRRGSLHELPTSDMDGDGQGSEMLLPNTLRLHLGDGQPRQDPNLRRPGNGSQGSRRGLTRDNSKRQERKEQRAAARADLRQRFSQYRRFVQESDIENLEQTKSIKLSRRLALKSIQEEKKAARTAIIKDITLTPLARLHANIAIDTESTRRKLLIEADYESKIQALKATRQLPLGWRIWLHEQANIGDQAALSALRGIVYQAQRDAKYHTDIENDTDDGFEESAFESHEQKYRQLMARLLEEERKEIAIRSARRNEMRPYETDSLLARYSGIQWRVTGNGNIEYSDKEAAHLFTDRGNRITFDRVRVTDEEIRLALIHAQEKFGKELTLTGEDPVFAARMASLADDMGITILNPELQSVIENHRNTKMLQITQAATFTTTPIKANEIETKSQEVTEVNEENFPTKETLQERLRTMVLSIDPHAEFIIPDPADGHRIYTGSVAAVIAQSEDSESGFAQHIGRSIYALHSTKAPEHSKNVGITIKYHEERPVEVISNPQKEKGRTD